MDMKDTNKVITIAAGIGAGLGLLYVASKYFINPDPATRLKGYSASAFAEMYEGRIIHRRDRPYLLEYFEKIYSNREQKLYGITVVLTGATTGLGRGIAAHLVACGATLILPCRRDLPEFKKDLIAEANDVRKIYGTNVSPVDDDAEKRIFVVKMDLGDLKSVKNCVIQIQEVTKRVDVLINNAGLVNPDGKLSPQGIEMTTAVNAVGTVLFTQLLLRDGLISWNKSSETNFRPRIVAITSEEHRASPVIDLSKHLLEQAVLKNLSMGTMMSRYSFSKLLLTTFMMNLAEKSNHDPNSDLIVLDVCPGAVATQIAEKHDMLLVRLLGPLVSRIMRTGFLGFLLPHEAALSIIRFVVDENPHNFGGGHFFRSQRKEAREDAEDKKVQQWVLHELGAVVNQPNVNVHERRAGRRSFAEVVKDSDSD